MSTSLPGYRLHQVGDPVQLKLDAYRFMQHGTAKGVIKSISEGSFTIDDNNGRWPRISRRGGRQGSAPAQCAGGFPIDSRHDALRRHHGGTAHNIVLSGGRGLAHGFGGDARTTRGTAGRRVAYAAQDDRSSRYLFQELRT